MRARRRLILGWALVTIYAAALVAVTVTTDDAPRRPGDRPPDADVIERFIDAWERSREATFVRSGTFERRSEQTDAAITSEDVVAQRPPQRLHRQLGGVEGRDDDRMILCPADPGDDGAQPGCTLGAPGGPTYDEDVANEVHGLRTLLEGATPVYAVVDGDDGCFDLEQLRSEPRAPFGIEAQFCFDAETGAPTNSRVRYSGGIVEVVAVTSLTGTVRDADLEP